MPLVYSWGMLPRLPAARKALSVGADASLAGIAEITNAVSATSVDGRADAAGLRGQRRWRRR